MPVSQLHPDYISALPRVKLVRDFSDGDFAVKAGPYLPGFVPADKDRYEKYKERAYVLGFTGRTKESLVGMIFRNPATIEVPPKMEPILENLDGSGSSIAQVAKLAAGDLLEAGRYVFFVDYPEADPGADSEASQGLRPVVAGYPLESLINWKTSTINNISTLTMAVLAESSDASVDEFGHESQTVYRVLRLRDGVYTQQMYGPDDVPLTDEFAPRMAGGRTFDHIPLHIAGSQNNAPSVDVPTLYQLAVINKAHYQITADHRENLFMHGQLTLGISTSLDFQSFIDANPGGVQVGARTGHFLGENGSFSVATAPESSSLRVALKDLEAQAVGIGAQIIERGGQAETAEAARIKSASEVSALDTLTGNLSEALEASLEDVALYMGADPESVEYELSTSFWESTLDSQELTAVVAARQNGVIAATDALNMIRNGEIGIESGRDNETVLRESADESFDLL